MCEQPSAGRMWEIANGREILFAVQQRIHSLPLAVSGRSERPLQGMGLILTTWSTPVLLFTVPVTSAFFSSYFFAVF